MRKIRNALSVLVILAATALLLTACALHVTPSEAVLPCDGSGVLLTAEFEYPDDMFPTGEGVSAAEEPPLPPMPPVDWYRDGELVASGEALTYLATSPGTYLARSNYTVPAGPTMGEEVNLESEPVVVHPCEPQTVADECVKSYVEVVIYGGWNGIPVKCYVGGTEQPTLYTRTMDSGEHGVEYIYWPPAGQKWNVSVAPQTPPEKDSARWQYKLISIESNVAEKQAENNPTSGQVSIGRCQKHTIYFQLIDTAVQPLEQ